MNELEHRALLGTIDELARDVGTLRRRFASNPHAWTGAYISDRLAGNLETLHNIASPSAAEIAASVSPGDDATVLAALDYVDQRTGRLRRLQGRTA